MKELQIKNEDWLKSKDAMKALKVSSCDLAHLRMEGKLSFKKEGNTFYILKKKY